MYLNLKSLGKVTPPSHTHILTFVSYSRLGAWQFLADMPYGSISLKTAWMIFWNIYCKDQHGSGAMAAASTATEEGGDGEEVEGQRVRVMSPSTAEEIQDAIRGGCYIYALSK